MEAAMSEGLIGGLPRYDQTSRGVEISDWGYFIDEKDLLALLRSDETVEAVAEAMYLDQWLWLRPWASAPDADRIAYRETARAALRVLAGSDE
jgi:hypothetical protein